MSTTVPQNIKGSNIAGRHTPTRSSLRHSRMIVVNKNYQGTQLLFFWSYYSNLISKNIYLLIIFFFS